MRPPRLLTCVFILSCALAIVARAAEPDSKSTEGVLPTDAQGRPLNLDFETGTLKDWTATGAAFAGQPIAGDAVVRRRPDMKSGHAGKFWIGGYEKAGDAPRGTLTSAPFVVKLPYARFLIAGGPSAETRVELVRADTKAVIFHASGDETENLKAVVADLSAHVGKEIFVRLVDEHSGGWGHLNFDDFKLFATKPEVPPSAQPLRPDQIAHDGLPPAEAAAAMTVPKGFQVTLFAAEPDVVQPISFAIDDRGRLWVAEAYSYPVRVPEKEAKDRILIFEDEDGDGKFDKRTVFYDKLNLVSGIEVGHGGVWVGAAPQFLFIPDANRDDKPDGPPQVLLDGWGHQDTHETLNSFKWGPDGWLYGCHGVFTHSRVGKPGTPDADRVPINAGIWRYHPKQHVFEVFAHGTSNPWGVDFDRNGQAFITACVIPHLYHMIQGGRYERQAGPHFNPYTYDDIKTIADHRHYLGANPHGGNGRSDQAGGGHAHAGALIYKDAMWPEEYRHSIFMNNIHGARLNRDVLERSGSGFVGKHAPDFLLTNDRWSQIISIKSGPDGQVYMIDWYDKNQCHSGTVAAHDRTNGRIFKITAPGARPVAIDLQQMKTAELIGLLTTENGWNVEHVLRNLSERLINKADRARLAELTSRENTPVNRLRAYWGLHAVGGLKDEEIKAGLEDPYEYIRAWTIQLAVEESKTTPALLAKFAELARSDKSPVVRLYLAAALQQLPLEQRWEILSALVQHSEDAGDHNLPLMYWYAAEPLAAADPSRALQLAVDATVPPLSEYMARRIAALDKPGALEALVAGLGKTDRPALIGALLRGVNEALRGRRVVGMPAQWPEVALKLAKSTDPQVRVQATALAVTFGDPAALKSLRAVLIDAKAELAARRDALAALLKVQARDLAPTLQSLLADPALRGQALRGLAAYDDPKTAEAILSAYTKLTLDERRDALNTLAARLDWAKALLSSVGEERISAKDLSADVVRQLRNHKNAELDEQIGKVWGQVRETSADRTKLIAEYKAKLSTKPAHPPDTSLGRAMFVKTCRQCHTLFGVGGKVGPDLTGSNRADLDYVLANVLDPSALIGKDYAAHIVTTTNGRVLTGIIRSEDKDSLTVLSANDIVTIPKSEIEERRQSDQSMMPDDLWKTLSEPEIRSLVAYLASPAQVPMLATAENAPGFFNGRDLTGWEGNHELWTVDNGEIVGKTKGLAHNDFLRSELVADDFRLTLMVKLVKNEGNSGIQFRSVALPMGEMRGDQADVGAGWWGKLYEENGRGLLWDKSGESFVKPDDWNRYEVVAIGDTIRTYINGKLCVDLNDPKGARRGIFAFQLHSGGPTEVRFKDIRLEVDPKSTEPTTKPETR